MQDVRTECPICDGHCGLNVQIENGRITQVTGDKESKSRGFLCPQGLAIMDIIYAADRLLHPKIRKNNSWEIISWNEALDVIVNNLNKIKDKYGPEAVNFHSTNLPLAHFQNKLAGLYGSPNVSNNNHICFWPRRFVVPYIFGYPDIYGTDVYGKNQYEYSKCILFWGQNPEHPPYLAKKIMDLHKKGTKLIIIDPYATSFARKADVHLQLRPGTDGALALSMLNIIINRELIDDEFIERWTLGFDKLKTLIMEFSPEQGEKITWVPKEKIVKAALIYAKNKPSCIALGNGMEHHTNNFNAIRAISYLIAITGNIDIPGGNNLALEQSKTWAKQVIKTTSTVTTKHKKESTTQIGQQLPLFPWSHLPSVWDAILTGKPYAIKAMTIMRANPAVTCANKGQVNGALKQLKFLVVVDRFMTPTAKFANIVLPSATSFESGFKTKIIEPLGECWSDLKIILELAKKMGFEKEFPSTLEEAEKIQLPKIKYSKYQEGGFPTPSGKVELYSNRLKELGFGPLPVYVEPKESPVSNPQLAEKFPLVLTSGRRLPMYHHSQFRNIPKLRKLMPENIVEIHPETAEIFSINHGDEVIVESQTGNIKLKAKLTNNVLKGVILSYHGFEDSNINTLINHNSYDLATGSVAFKSSLCRIKKRN